MRADTPVEGRIGEGADMGLVSPVGADLRMSSLAAMARALGRSHPLARLLEIAADEAREALAAASVSISRLEAGTTTIRTVINVGELGPDEQRWPEDEVYTIHPGSNLGLVVDELQTWTASVTDPGCPPFELELLTSLGKGSALGAPIMVDGQLWGEFYATRRLGAASFSDSESSYLQALVAILAGAVSRSAREASLERLAFRDPLTGLHNRRSLDEQADKAFNVPSGATRSVTVVGVDINRLKLVNDNLGHSAGDRLIQAVGRAMLEQFGPIPGSLVARVGGDEFTVLVSGHDPARVVAAANRLCQESWGFGRGVGVSTGAASLLLTDASTATPAELFAAADRAQYDAKRRGLAYTVVA